jgi:hypothetical protein
VIPVNPKNSILFNISQKLNMNTAADRTLKLYKLSDPKGDRTNPSSRRDLVARALIQGATFEHVPKTVTCLIQNFIEPKQIATNIHPVNSRWRNLWGNNGHLDLSDSNITNDDLERIIQEYKKCGKLVSINLSGCEHITNAGLAHLTGIPLKRLNLSGCFKITHAGLAHLTGIPLKRLNLSGCFKITDAGLAHLTGIPLKRLNLSGCFEITDAGLAHLAGIPLEQLNLSFCENITDAGLAHFANAPLEQLDLSLCRNITDAGLAYFAKAPLKKLNLVFTKITDAGFAYFTNAPITHLNLNHTKTTYAGLAHFANAPLKELDIVGCNIVGCESSPEAGIVSRRYIILSHLNQTKLGKVNDRVSHSEYPTPQSLILGYLEE